MSNRVAHLPRNEPKSIINYHSLAITSFDVDIVKESLSCHVRSIPDSLSCHVQSIRFQCEEDL